jgi:hypothetical protein
VLRVRVRREGYDLGAIIANLRETIRVGGEPAARTAWLAWTIGAAEGFQPAVDMREIFRSRARLAGLARRGQYKDPELRTVVEQVARDPQWAGEKQHALVAEVQRRRPGAKSTTIQRYLNEHRSK